MLICISDVTCGKVRQARAPHLRRQKNGDSLGYSQFAENVSNFSDGACKKSSPIITGFPAISVTVVQCTTGGITIILFDYSVVKVDIAMEMEKRAEWASMACAARSAHRSVPVRHPHSTQINREKGADLSPTTL